MLATIKKEKKVGIVVKVKCLFNEERIFLCIDMTFG